MNRYLRGRHREIVLQVISRLNQLGVSVERDPATELLILDRELIVSYQWLRGGVVVSTSSNLTIANPSEPDAGIFTIKVTSSYGSATSSPIGIRVQSQRPAIITQ